MGWESPEKGCAAPLVKPAQQGKMGGGLEGQEAVFMGNRHTIGLYRQENKPTQRHFMWISGAQKYLPCINIYRGKQRT